MAQEGAVPKPQESGRRPAQVQGPVRFGGQGCHSYRGVLPRALREAQDGTALRRLQGLEEDRKGALREVPQPGLLGEECEAGSRATEP